MKTYSISSYGRLGYLIQIFVSLFGSAIFTGTSLKIWSAGKYLPSVVFMLLGFIGILLLIYSTIQLFKTSPRFALDDKGIICPGVYGPSKIFWENITSYRLNRLAGAMVFIDLHFEEGKLFRKFKRLDASGLTPNYKYLCEDLDSYLRQYRR